MTEAKTVTTCLPLPYWLRDHHFDGKAILPAVEAMQLLAKTARTTHSALNVLTMEAARFNRFLELPQDREEIDIIVEMEVKAQGRLRARLLTRRQLATMSRLTVHCELFFCFDSAEEPETASPLIPATDPGTKISAERIYQELVPFGPMFRTLEGQLCIMRNSAVGRLRTPNLPLDFAATGSPFSLDGAMHAACVHGQRLVDFVPFPVGFDRKIISNPTKPGEEYSITICLRSIDKSSLAYDLQVLDYNGRVRETVMNLMMRDVSNGRIKPPEWIRQDGMKDRESLGCLE